MRNLREYCLISSLFIPISLTSCQHIEIKPNVSLENLIVNESNYYRTVVNKSEEEGIKDIKNILENSFLEEAWVFLPKSKKWIEIGEEEKREIIIKEVDDKNIAYSYSSGANLSGYFINELFEKESNILFYHFHPNPKIELKMI